MRPGCGGPNAPTSSVPGRTGRATAVQPAAGIASARVACGGRTSKNRPEFRFASASAVGIPGELQCARRPHDVTHVDGGPFELLAFVRSATPSADPQSSRRALPASRARHFLEPAIWQPGSQRMRSRARRTGMTRAGRTSRRDAPCAVEWSAPASKLPKREWDSPLSGAGWDDWAGSKASD